MRGRLVSRPVEQVLGEAARLARAGVRELMVIAQDTSAYGSDLKYRKGTWREREYATRFQDLCEGLGSLGIWIRLHYVYPYPHVDQVIPLMAERRILPYLDVPFQHGSPRVLKAMKRPAAAENTLERIQAWRDICPDITVRSTFIVGFPGETESEFQELLGFIQEAQLDRVGCFQYSPVEGARANDIGEPVPDEVKQERWERFMELQQSISVDKLARRQGQQIEVLVDEVTGEGAVGRSWADAPEIDGLVYLDGDSLMPGHLVTAEVTGTDEYDLHARVITD